MIYYVDIDETICVSPESRDYSLAIPIKENIEKINNLYEEHTIIYWIAKGNGYGNDLSKVKKKKFK